ncbi:MAG: OmpA family protein [Bacteroidetes bacterium]|nr:OmpA family protein [Bacteroidota bacterium]
MKTNVINNDLKILLRGEGIAPREIWMKGTTRNANDSLPVQTRVACVDLATGRKMNELSTGLDGIFRFKLFADRNYGFMAEKENFIATSLNIDLSKHVPDDTIHRDIYLTEIKPGAIIRLNCIFFEFDKSNLLPDSESDLKRLLEIISTHKNLYFEIHGHTDSVGNATYNQNLSKARATSVMNYLVKTVCLKKN